MKLSKITILLVLCIITHQVTADWRDDIATANRKKMSSLLTALQKYFVTSANMYHTSGAWWCAHVTNTPFSHLRTTYISQISECLESAANEAEAHTCSDNVDKSLIQKVATMNIVTTNCITNT